MTDATAATSVRPFRIEIPQADAGYLYDWRANFLHRRSHWSAAARARWRRAGTGGNAPEGSDANIVARNRRSVASRPLDRSGPGRRPG